MLGTKQENKAPAANSEPAVTLTRLSKITSRSLVKSQACHKSVRKKREGRKKKKRENHFRSLYISLMDFAPVAPVFQCCAVTLPCSLKQRAILRDVWDFQGKSHRYRCSTSRGAPASPCSAKNPNPLAAQKRHLHSTQPCSSIPNARSSSLLPQPL